MKRKAAVAGAIVLTVALAGCGTGGASPQTSDSTSISTGVPDEPVTLKFSYAGQQPAESLVAGFQELYPNVEFDLELVPFADYQTSLKLSLSGSEVPDLVQYSPAPMRAIVPAGLMQPLDEYAEAYGWEDKIPQSLLGIMTSDKEMTEYGSGTLWAVPGGVSILGVFYNKSLVEAAGIEGEPETLADFEDDLATVRDSGTTPLALPANSTGGFQLWGALSNIMADPAALSDWVYGVPGSTVLDDPGFEEAASTIQSWAGEGMFDEGVSAVADPDALDEVKTGKRAYFLTGNWNAKALSDALGDDLGFFLLPGVEADQPAIASGTGAPYGIPANAKNKDVAAAFLDYIVSEQAGEAALAGGFIPIQPTETDSGSVTGVIVDSYASVIEGSGVAPFVNWTTPSMLDPLTSGVQGLISGNLAPRAFLESLQADWESNH